MLLGLQEILDGSPLRRLEQDRYMFGREDGHMRHRKFVSEFSLYTHDIFSSVPWDWVY